MARYQIQYRFVYFAPGQWEVEDYIATDYSEVERNSWFTDAEKAYAHYKTTHYYNRGCVTNSDGVDNECDYSVRIIDLDSDFIIFCKLARGGDSGALCFATPFTLPEVYTPINEEGLERKMIKVGIVRESGKLKLVVDAKEFHDTLDTLGVAHDGTMYQNRPQAGNTISSSRFEMSTECLLRREYPAKFDLNGLWSSPPKSENLTALCESAHAAARKVLDHYQPIDISIEIQKKIVK